MTTPAADPTTRLLRAVREVEAASGTPHAAAIATASGLTVPEVEDHLLDLAKKGLVTVEGVGAGQDAWTSQPAYRLTDVGEAALPSG